MKALVIISALSFGGALIVYALAVVARRRARLRRCAADPYAKPFGDVPAPARPLRLISINTPIFEPRADSDVKLYYGKPCASRFFDATRPPYPYSALWLLAGRDGAVVHDPRADLSERCICHEHNPICICRTITTAAVPS